MGAEREVSMKLLALSLVGIACLPAFAQDQPNNRERRACLIVAEKFLKCQSTAYGTPENQRFARTAHVGDIWFPVGSDPITVTLEAASIRSDHADVTYLNGKVEIHTEKLVLLADQAVYHSETGEIEATGNVQVTPTR
jgi:lipopolysaccharide assembly outer membrane protein LptD (OstA)